MVIFEKNDVRISLLLPTVLRVEKGNWTDLPTQTVLHRDHGRVDCTAEEKNGKLIVKSAEAAFCVNIADGKVLSISLADGTEITDLESGILPGTARTLDQANGAVKLEKGGTIRRKQKKFCEK